MLSNGSDTGASSISLEDFSDEVTIEAVETLVQYKFHDSALLWEALHTQGPTPDGNKRLAIVDDSVLALALSEDWYRGKTTRGHWSTEYQQGVGSNENLARSGRTLGLEKYIRASVGKKAPADTVEAILGAIYLDSGNDIAKCKNTMDAMDLLPREQRLERDLDVEGLVILTDREVEKIRSKKRTISPVGTVLPPSKRLKES